MKEKLVAAVRLLVGPFYSMVHTLPKIASAPAYFTDAPRKSWLRRYFDLLIERFVKGSTNHFYSAYGLDLKGKTLKDVMSYCSEREWWKFVARNTANIHNSTVCLRNKLTFNIFCNGAGLPTPQVFAAKIGNRHFMIKTKNSVGGGGISSEMFSEELKKRSVFFYKGALGCCARSVAKIEVRDGNFFIDGQPCDLDAIFPNEEIVVCQEQLVQHPQMAALNPTSVNTIRMITVRSGNGEIKLFDALLRVGGTAASVDNWAAGGLAIAVDDGKLDKYGYYKATLKKDAYVATHHPITGVKFEGFEIPFYDDALAMVIYAHDLLGDLAVVGWDVAISPQGPVLIEGNDDPELTLHQIVRRRGFAEELKAI